MDYVIALKNNRAYYRTYKSLLSKICKAATVHVQTLCFKRV